MVCTYLSASSRIIILCLPGGSVTFCWANIFILFLTVSIPRSLDAFNSRTASLNALPKSILASASMVVVLPTPGGPCINYGISLIDINRRNSRMN